MVLCSSGDGSCSELIFLTLIIASLGGKFIMVTTTQTSTNTSIRPEIRFEMDYLKSIHGMLKVALLVSISYVNQQHF